MKPLKRLLEAEIISNLCAAAALVPCSIISLPESLALGLACLVRLVLWLTVLSLDDEAEEAQS